MKLVYLVGDLESIFNESSNNLIDDEPTLFLRQVLLVVAVLFGDKNLHPLLASHIHKAHDRRLVENQNCRGQADWGLTIPVHLRSKGYDLLFYH